MNIYWNKVNILWDIKEHAVLKTVVYFWHLYQSHCQEPLCSVYLAHYGFINLIIIMERFLNVNGIFTFYGSLYPSFLFSMCVLVVFCRCWSATCDKARKGNILSVQQVHFFIQRDFRMMFLWLSSHRDLNEASLLWNLKIRYDKELIYVSLLIMK
jgi:hypothetical protein